MWMITYRTNVQGLFYQKKFSFLNEAREYFDWISQHPEVHSIMFFDNHNDLIEVL